MTVLIKTGARIFYLPSIMWFANYSLVICLGYFIALTTVMPEEHVRFTPPTIFYEPAEDPVKHHSCVRALYPYSLNTEQPSVTKGQVADCNDCKRSADIKFCYL